MPVLTVGPASFAYTDQATYAANRCPCFGPDSIFQLKKDIRTVTTGLICGLLVQHH